MQKPTTHWQAKSYSGPSLVSETNSDMPPLLIIIAIEVYTFGSNLSSMTTGSNKRGGDEKLKPEDI
jgi:hypothetical protein